MKCDEIRELMPDLASGLMEVSTDISSHVAGCSVCAAKLAEFRKTMALLDEWRAPEPSPYFDVRLQARLREAMAKPQPGWFGWLRRPALAAALTVLIGLGVGLYVTKEDGLYNRSDEIAAAEPAQSEPGTAVSDLQSLDKNHDLYSDFDLLDDLQVQQDVTANP